ncbi:MAG TPA: hypothetical protein VGX28_13960 [Frankiaceae bacterium]|jgi:hypothetical protein|nr:hypothetical protein [Frankiaceae bacterium]
MADVDPAGSARLARLGTVPRGSGATLAGIVVSGLSGFGALALATRGVEVGSRGALAAAWTLVFLVGPAVFFPLEQALAGRLLGSSAVAGRHVASVAGAWVAGLAVVAAVSAPLYVDDLLDGRTGLLLAVVASLAGYAAQHVLRAVLVARRSFGRYALVLGVDGLVRLVGCGVAYAAGARSPEPYAWVAGLAPLVATAVCLPGLGRSAGGGAGGGRVGADVGRLVAASLCANVVVGAGPAVLKLLSDDPALVSSYLVTVSLTRIPLLLGQALLAPLLAGLAGADDAAFRRTLRGAVLAVLAAGVVTTAAFALLAPPLVPVLFGRDNDRLGAGPAAVLAACAVTFLVGQLLTQALVARGRAGAAAAGWAVSLAVAAVTLAVWPGSLGQVLGATLVGCVGAAVLLAGYTRSRKSVTTVSDDAPPTPVR